MILEWRELDDGWKARWLTALCVDDMARDGKTWRRYLTMLSGACAGEWVCRSDGLYGNGGLEVVG